MAGALDRAKDWLYYNRTYRVLICRDCQHAIQKSAIDSHLLKHKIYRGERQSLVSEIAGLDLPEPGDVQQPSHRPPPVEGLPVLHGYRCAFGECGHLTLSEKRVKQHWNESHSDSLGSHLPPVSTISRPAYLQTLFKGTKLNYFEVTVDSGESSSVTKFNGGDRLSGAGTTQISSPHEGRCADTLELASARTSTSSLASLPLTLDITPSVPTRGLDLETLSCLHHFITVTAHGLPGGPSYWTDQAFALARDHATLMNGLLALAARQQALMASTADASQKHQACHEKYYQDFQEMWSTMLVGETQHQTTDYQIMALAEQIGALLRCARRAATQNITSRTPWTCLSFTEIVYDIGLCCARKIEPQEPTPSDHNTDEALFQATCQYLHELPSRMAHSLGRPTSAEDVLAALAAISALRKCCETSFPSETAASAWDGVATWWTTVPEHFHRMLNSRYVAAIVVFTHWAAILVRRAEQKGCWPLQSLSETILSECGNYLSANAPSAGALIADVLALQ